MRGYYQRTKGKVQIYWRLGRKELPLVLSGLTAVSALLLESADRITFPLMIALLGVFGTAFDWWRLNQKSKEYQLVREEGRVWEDLRLSSSYSGWLSYSRRYGTAWFDPRVNEMLSEQPITIQRERPPTRVGRILHRSAKFELPPSLRGFERYILLGQSKDSIIFNENKIRIGTDLSVDILARALVGIERTTYFDSLCTNDLTEWVLQVRGTPSVSDALVGIDVVSSNGLLRDLSERGLSNHVGGSTLAFTSDDYLVIQRQTMHNRQSGGRTAPSGSGSLRWKDTRHATTLQDFVKTGLTRELVEETGTPRSKPVPLEILGVVRHAHRGGQVEFYGVARLPLSMDQVRTKRGERLYVFDRRPMKCQLDDPEKLAEEVSHIHQALLSGRGDVSFPLEVAMMLLVDALKQRPALVARALGVKWDARPEQNPISRSV